MSYVFSLTSSSDSISNIATLTHHQIIKSILTVYAENPNTLEQTLQQHKISQTWIKRLMQATQHEHHTPEAYARGQEHIMLTLKIRQLTHELKDIIQQIKRTEQQKEDVTSLLHMKKRLSAQKIDLIKQRDQRHP